MFLYKSATNKDKTSAPILVAKHGSHNQASHGRKGGGGGSSSGENSRAGGLSSADLRELARLNFGNSGSRKGLKRGDTLDNIKNAEGVRVKISGGSALGGKKGRVVQSAPSGKFHGVKTDDGQEGYISGADLTVISLEKSIDINMEKHGSHNQASHGRKGGSGGGGNSSRKSPQSNEDKLVEAAEELNNLMAGAKRVRDKATDRNAYDLANGTIKGYKAVFDALGDKKKMKMVRINRDSKAGMVMSGSLAPLQEGYRENVGFVNGATMALAQYGDL